MNKTLDVFLGGLITIGIITALVLPGRNSVRLADTAFKGTSNLLGTAIKG